jgi:glycosylphosphatidylinositol phospholipase D
VAFAMGQVSHSVADILWHDLSEVRDLTGQGFIRAQANIYFDTTYSTSHTLADVGAEFAIASDTSTSWLESTWFVPSEDIQETYLSMNISAGTADVVEDGMALLYTVAHLASLAGSFLDPLEEFASPFIQEDLFSYHIGGIDDSSQWTAACWPTLIKWLEKGADNSRLCLVEPPTVAEAKTSQKRGLEKHAPRGIVRHLMAHPKLSKAIRKLLPLVSATRVPEARGAFITWSKPAHYIKSVLEKVLRESGSHHKKPVGTSSAGSAQCRPLESLPNVIQLQIDAPYSNLGESMVQGDFDGDGLAEWAVGAPGFTPEPGMEQAGVVFIQSLPKSLKGHQRVPLRTSKDSFSSSTNTGMSLTGSHRSGRFGQSLAVVDLNRDGADDLVVSEPRFLADQLSYRGRVYVYYGSPSGLSSTPGTFITLDDIGGNFTMMGASLSQGDLDQDGFQDLLIGSPYACSINDACTSNNRDAHQRGLVSVFLSSTWRQSHEIDLGKADFSLLGAGAYFWFGQGSAVVNFHKTAKLVVSAPIGNYTSGSVAPGTLMAFDVKELAKHRPTPKPSAAIYSTTNGAKLGWSFSVGTPYQGKLAPNPLLAVSAPSDIVFSPGRQAPLFEAGRVYLAPLGFLNGSFFTETTGIPSIDGTEPFGRFGWSTLLSDFDSDGLDDLVVSAPMEAHEQGRIYLWRGGPTFPSKSTTAASRDLCIELPSISGEASRPRLGLQLASFKASPNSPSLLAISAPRDSTLANSSGVVYVIAL